MVGFALRLMAMCDGSRYSGALGKARARMYIAGRTVSTVMRIVVSIWPGDGDTC